MNSGNFSSTAANPVSRTILVRLRKQKSITGTFILLLLIIIGCTKSEASSHPDLLAATIQIKHKGTKNEIHEIWMVDTRDQEKNLIFTTTQGTRLSLIEWGFDQSNLLYILEIKGIGEGNLTWQLYEVNYNTGINRTFFDEPQIGLPRLVDFSSEGKWLRLEVDDMSPDEKTWLINTNNNEVVKLNQDYTSFVWSPNDPDIFAHWQSPLTERDENAPYSVVIRNINTLEVIDSIKFDSLDWGSYPFLIWPLYQPNHIKMFFHTRL